MFIPSSRLAPRCSERRRAQMAPSLNGRIQRVDLLCASAVKHDGSRSQGRILTYSVSRRTQLLESPRRRPSFAPFSCRGIISIRCNNGVDQLPVDSGCFDGCHWIHQHSINKVIELKQAVMILLITHHESLPQMG